MVSSKKYAAIVVGAGPAGLAVVGNLLERQLGGKIAWIDPCFQGGRVNRKYREVPSNTKAGLFQCYIQAVSHFRAVADNAPAPNPFTTLKKLDQERGCELRYAADMCRALTDGILKSNDVYGCRGVVTSAQMREDTTEWTVRIEHPGSEEQTEVVASRLFLCTGSSPTIIPLPAAGNALQRLELDTALKPSELVKYLPSETPVTIAVVGASHSAILVLLNLVNLARFSHPNLRIKWFTRNSLQYAEYLDGWILRDNTGLKGVAADFAREQLEDDILPTSDAGRFIEKIDCSNGKENAAYEAQLPSCSHIILAVGFTRDPLPVLSRDGKPVQVVFNHETGGFSDKTGEEVHGLYGAGIAFPERVIDPRNNVEYAVGFWKFMKFIQKSVPKWTGA